MTVQYDFKRIQLDKKLQMSHQLLTETCKDTSAEVEPIKIKAWTCNILFPPPQVLLRDNTLNSRCIDNYWLMSKLSM